MDLYGAPRQTAPCSVGGMPAVGGEPWYDSGMTKVAKTRVAAKPRVEKAEVKTEAKPTKTRVAKITISLPREQVEQAREAVARGEASSVSGYISAALVAVRPLLVTDEQDTLTAFAADLIAEDGVPSAEAYARADRFLAMSERD